MGGGRWEPTSYTKYAAEHIIGKQATDIYKVRAMKDDFNPKLIEMRESRDSEDHPNSSPIIIGLDLTGSMNRILSMMAKTLNDTVTGIIDKTPLLDPQVMFAGIGDSHFDIAPLQVTQFESDIRIAKQLTELFFERGGGFNNFESYPLIWHFASHYTSTDSYDKRKQKGFIFTMGDDGFPEFLRKTELNNIFSKESKRDIPTVDVLNEVLKKFEVFHFCLKQGNNPTESMRIDDWKDLLGERAIEVDDAAKLPEMIIEILKGYGAERGQAPEGEDVLDTMI